MKIAIQGIKGSFHHITANQYFGEDIALEECLSFDVMPKLLIAKKVNAIVMAIENSIAGAILPNYALLDEFNLKINGEVYLPIQHQLMALNNQTINDIKEVWSHPMALNQCKVFLRKYPHIKLVEESDTAEVARLITKNQLKGIAAIASKKAAEIYGLTIISDNIQTNSENYTRFFILNTTTNTIEFNKVSIKFITNHEKGSLAEVLNILVKHQLNLTKIQSLPIIDSPWKYSFFADFLIDDNELLQIVLKELKTVVAEIVILGKYNSNNAIHRV